MVEDLGKNKECLKSLASAKSSSEKARGSWEEWLLVRRSPCLGWKNCWLPFQFSLAEELHHAQVSGAELWLKVWVWWISEMVQNNILMFAGQRKPSWIEPDPNFLHFKHWQFFASSPWAKMRQSYGRMHSQKTLKSSNAKSRFWSWSKMQNQPQAPTIQLLSPIVNSLNFSSFLLKREISFYLFISNCSKIIIFFLFTDSEVWPVTTHIRLENNLVTVLLKRSLVKWIRL